MLRISEIFIYPIKSLGGISLTSCMVTDRGFEYDRRWMLVDEQNKFMTQREVHSMALLQVSITNGGLQVTHKQNGAAINIPLQLQSKEFLSVQIWNDVCTAQCVSVEADEWLSQNLSMKCRLVYMPDDSRRAVDKNYARHNEITSFSDAYPFLIIGQSSLDDLNKKLHIPLPINRFRPNLVFTGGAPYEEDVLTHFQIRDVDFFGVKLCARCVVTTIDQETADSNKEPLKTLATYRAKENKIYFGQNLLHHGKGRISVGDEIKIVESKTLIDFG